MAKMTRTRLLARIRELRDTAAALSPQVGTDAEAYHKWKNDVVTLLANVFGEESRHTQQFSKISFTPSVYSLNGGDDYRWTNAFQRGVTRSCAFLDSLAGEVTEFYEDDIQSESPLEAAQSELAVNAQNNVFVVHGRNQLLATGMFAFLRSIGLRPMEWSQAIGLTGKPMPYVRDILHAAFTNAAAVVVLMTPDDIASLRDECARVDDPPHEINETGQARPNVLFEAGMAMGYAPDRTIIVEVGELRPFTDISGFHVVRMDGSSQRRQELANRLGLCGCDVDLTGTDWHSTGDLRTELATAPQPGSRPKPGGKPASTQPESK